MNIRPEKNLVETSARLLDALRTQTALVQCITNTVVMNVTANALLAVGAAPAMVDIPGEAGPFAGVASAVLINTGTPHAEQRTAMVEAARAARNADVPWVLDPVAVGSLPVRTALARELVALRPTVIRGNPSEIIALAGLGEGPRGVDSTVGTESAVDAATYLADTYGSIVAISGPTDVVIDGNDSVRLTNGHFWLTRVTGGGCALGAVIAAFASVSSNRFETTVAACSVYTIAAEIAAENSSGPGSFATAFLDALYSIRDRDVRERAVIA